jgi:hypothetical protein
MKPPHWPKIEEAYHAAREKQPAERQAFLKPVCGKDADRRREVQLLH